VDTSGSSRARNKAKTKRRAKGKGRHDLEFEKERAWVIKKLQEDAAAGLDNEEDGDGFECGCCFTTYPFVSCFVCPPSRTN
jgi:E3 ubiquitin-protein ligase RNF216